MAGKSKSDGALPTPPNFDLAPGELILPVDPSEVLPDAPRAVHPWAQEKAEEERRGPKEGTIQDDSSDPYAQAKLTLENIRRPYGLPDDPARATWKRSLRFLTDRQFPGGKTREVPRVTIESQPDGFRLTATDYNLSVKGTVDFEFAADWLKAFEDLIEGRRGKWIEVKSGDGYKRRKAEEERQLATNPDALYTLAKGGRDPKRRS